MKLIWIISIWAVGAEIAIAAAETLKEPTSNEIMDSKEEWQLLNEIRHFLHQLQKAKAGESLIPNKLGGVESESLFPPSNNDDDPEYIDEMEVPHHHQRKRTFFSRQNFPRGRRTFFAVGGKPRG